jgi:hypothetical protein
MGFLLRKKKPRRAFAGGVVTSSPRPLDHFVRLEDALEYIDGVIRHHLRSNDRHDDGFLRYCMGLREGLGRGYKLGVTAGYNKAKGRKPEHPGRRGPKHRIDPRHVSFFAFQLRELRCEGLSLRGDAERYLANMRAGAKARGEDLKREPLPSAPQLVGAYYRLRPQIPS